jgi:hypothetical protein
MMMNSDSTLPMRRILTGSPRATLQLLTEQITSWRTDSDIDSSNTGRIVIVTLDANTASVLRDELPVAVHQASPHGSISGLFNIDICTVSTLAHDILRSLGESDTTKSLPPNASLALIAEAIHRTRDVTTNLGAAHTGPGTPLDDPRERPTFHQAMLRTIIDLKKAGWTPDDVVRRSQHRYKDEISEIYRESERIQAENGFVDLSDIIANASTSVGKTDYFSGVTGIVIFGVTELNRLEETFVEALAQLPIPLTACIPWIADAPSFGLTENALRSLERSWGVDCTRHRTDTDPLESLVAELFRSDRNQIHTDSNISFVSAPDASREWTDAARRVWRIIESTANDADPIRFGDVRIIAPNINTVRPVAQDVFANAGIPVDWGFGTPVARSDPGRSLMLFLEVVDDGLSRESVMDLLTTCPLRNDWPGAESEPANPPEWDRIAREAGVIGSVGARNDQTEWMEPLRRFANHARHLLERPVSDSDDSAHHNRDRVESNEMYATQLLHVIGKLITVRRDIQSAERSANWGRWVSAVRNGWDALINFGPEHSEAIARIQTVLSELATYDNIVRLAPVATLRELLRGALDSARVALPTNGTDLDEESKNGVKIGDITTTHYRTPRVLIITGLVDGKYPARDARSALDVVETAPISTHTTDGHEISVEHSVAEVRLHFAMALSTGAEYVSLSYARSRPGGEDRHLPSSLYFETIRRVLQPPADTVWDETALEAALRVRDSWIERCVIPSVDTDYTWLGTREYDIYRAAMMQGMDIAELPHEARGARLLHERSTGVAGPYDGIIDLDATDLAFPGMVDSEHPISPSRVETYARCPFQYFLINVLRTKPLDDPLEELEIDALTRGDLIHKLLAEYFRTLTAEKIDLSTLNHDELGQSFDTFSESFRAKAQSDIGANIDVLHSANWATVQTKAFRAVEMAHAESADWLPGYTELGLGLPIDDRDADSHSDPEPINVPLQDGSTVRLRGRVDRVDLSRDGKHGRLVDYKSGKYNKDSYLFLNGGRNIQLAAYALGIAAWMERRGDTREVSEAAYHYLRSPLGDDDPRGKTGPFQARDAEELAHDFEDLRHVLGVITDGIRDARFPPYPDDSPDSAFSTCTHCDVREACGSLDELRLRWEAFQTAPTTEPMRNLRVKPEKGRGRG